MSTTTTAHHLPTLRQARRLAEALADHLAPASAHIVTIAGHPGAWVIDDTQQARLSDIDDRRGGNGAIWCSVDIEEVGSAAPGPAPRWPAGSARPFAELAALVAAAPGPADTEAA